MADQYIYREEIHNFEAPRQIVPLIMKMIKPSSVLDVGCGTGTWLKVFDENGITDYLGLDGDHIKSESLNFPAGKFIFQDLTKTWSLNRKFDLVISLEVGEHLPQSVVDNYVKTLADHAETILFSAAIPGQGGQNHLNEQWPEYWQKKFETFGFYFYDSIRPDIWGNEKIEWWYRQNIFILKKQKPGSDHKPVMSIIHPDLYGMVIRNHILYVQSLKTGKQGLKLSARIFVNAVLYKLKTLLGLK
jgi:SAM-dependent methyltransferase